MSRKRGRPRREYRLRVRAERRLPLDYPKLARALLEHAAIEDAARREQDGDTKATPAKNDATEREGGE
ncbi:hypothetical protein [Microbacterium schleiferi]|uniref:Uncharacterized protein n=1 Tax=Microbacterium schleiferi TaxID=69362 RepID=A0ABU7V9I1_9MICO